MKKLFTLAIAAAALSYLFTTGCVKADVNVNSTDNTNGNTDVSDFHLSAAASFIPGAAAVINIHSTTISDGDYTMNYSLSGGNVYTGNASMHMSGGAGSFNTQVLSAGASTSIIVNSITNSSGATTNITANNSSSFFDSSGTMHLNQQIGDPFYATDVTASITGSMLNIVGTMWEPDLRTANLTIYNFTTNNLPKTVTINTGSDGRVALTSGSIKVAAHGTITIQSINNSIIEGTYAGTWQDSSTFSGDFKGKLD